MSRHNAKIRYWFGSHELFVTAQMLQIETILKNAQGGTLKSTTTSNDGSFGFTQLETNKSYLLSLEKVSQFFPYSPFPVPCSGGEITLSSITNCKLSINSWSK